MNKQVNRELHAHYVYLSIPDISRSGRESRIMGPMEKVSQACMIALMIALMMALMIALMIALMNEAFMRSIGGCMVPAQSDWRYDLLDSARGWRFRGD